MNIDYDNFMKKVDVFYNEHQTKLRYGQTIMNILFTVAPNQYHKLVGTEYDCFYNDNNVEKTLQKLKELWNEHIRTRS